MTSHRFSISRTLSAISSALSTAFFCLLFFTTPALSIETLQDAVRQAVVHNPEVLEKWNTFLAAEQEQNVAKGGWLPSIDLNSRLGYHNLDNNFRNDDFQVREGSLELNQLLFDGSATSLNIEKFNHLKLARYYELLDTSEMIALEATRAYLDVLMFQRLLNLASTNYDQHYTIFKQVKERVQAGVGRGVDLEQATGRLALAESNRITEATNLHDVSSRYLRIIGEMPPETLNKPENNDQEIPNNIQDALRKAFTTNPGFIATMENMRAARADKKRTKSTFSPKLELHARHDTGYDRDTIEDHSNESVIELRLNYNIYRGGSDLATVRQFAHRVDVAEEQKNKVCRNIRQTLDIAYNDIQRLNLQLQQLDQHQKSISSAREAYHKQFDIGQRTLLDLLDTENEYFQAKHAYVTALYDHQLAYARTQAGMGNLLHSLEVRQEGFPAPDGLTRYSLEEIDPDAICPPIAAPLIGLGETRVITASTPDVETSYADAALLASEFTPQSVETADLDPEKATLPKSVPLAIEPTKETNEVVTSAGTNQPVGSLDIHFPVGEATLSDQDLAEIDNIGRTMQEFPVTVITLAGHTDSTGPEVFNFNLSRSRAEAVRNHLIYIHGIDPSRVLITWYSSSKPVVSNETSAGRKQNRRTDAQLLVTLSKPDDLKKVKQSRISD